MAGISGMISKALDFLTTGYESNDDPYEKLAEEMGAKYPTTDNVALKPEYTTAPIKKQPKGKDNVVAYPGARGNELMVIEPRSFYEDSMNVINHLKDGRTVVLNLHLLDKDQAQRLVDFMSGATHALNGHQQKIADAVFIFAPTNIAISADSLKTKTSMSDGLWSQRQY